jgi:hypothetical protein
MSGKAWTFGAYNEGVKVEASSLAEAQDTFKKEYNLNPFYFVFIDDTGAEVYNEHLPLCVPSDAAEMAARMQQSLNK